MKLRLSLGSLQKASSLHKSLAYRVLAVVVTLFTYSASAQSNSSETSCSFPFQTKGDLLNRSKIEILKPEDEHYLNLKNREVIELSKKFKYLSSIKTFIYDHLKIPTKKFKSFGHEFSLEIDTKHFTQTIYQEISGHKKQFFTTQQIDKPNGRTRILTLSISPNGSLAVIHTRDGSIDRKFVTFLSADGEVLRTLPLDSGHYGWIAPKTFVFSAQFGLGSRIRTLQVTVDKTLKEMPLEKLKETDLSKITTYGEYSYAKLAVSVQGYQGERQSPQEKTVTARFDPRNGQFVIVNTPLDDEAIYAGTYKSKRYIIARGAALDSEQVIYVENVVPQQQKAQIIDKQFLFSKYTTLTFPFTIDYIADASIQGSHLLLNIWVSGKNYLTLIDLDNRDIRSVPIPDAHRLTKYKVLNANRVEVVISSAIHKSTKLIYDFSKRQYVGDLARLYTKDNVEYVTEIVRYKSFDGTDVPLRLAYRKDTKKDGNTPVYIEAYGDYNSPGPYTSGYSDTEYAFMRDGGILAYPAIRGGGELGIKWHQAGMLGNRSKIYEDLASCAKYLIEQNFTTPSKITLHGASAGGLATATTSLFFPEYFGLAIPANGPMDIEHHAEMRNSRTSWYAVHQPENLAIWQNLSPMRNAANIRDLKFLFLVGRMDTRVNPHHSLMMAQELEKYANNPEQVLLLSSNHTGHFSYSPPSSGHIGIFQASMMWAYIYHLMGMKFGQ